jgi:hypothetical protein
MGKPLIHLVLTDDWELRGDGSGDMRAMQFATIKELVSIYNKFGLRGTFMAEVMQQLYHRRLGSLHAELGALADEWEITLRDIHSQGHDVQLHLHLHWQDAKFDGDKWSLGSPWSVADYTAVDLRNMIEAGKSFLERLLCPVNAAYRCCAFRAGSYLAVPSQTLLATMAELGLSVDVSLVPGWHINSVFLGQRLFVDYRRVEEEFLPYFPAPDDIRRRGPRGSVRCLPINTFHFGPVRRCQRWLRKVTGMLRRGVGRPAAKPKEGGGGNVYDRRSSSLEGGRPRWERLRNLLLSGRRMSDLSQLSFWETKLVLKDIRRQALRSGWKEVPVVVTNHTKDIRDFGTIRRFAELVASAADIQVLTLREVCDNFAAGRYPV